MVIAGKFDRRKTLDELDPPAWGDPPYDSHLVLTCHRLRGKPVNEFVIEDLRIMIGQEIGLPFLLPLAIEALERDPLAEGDFYPGDLLANVLGVPAAVWLRNPGYLNRLEAVIQRAELTKTLERQVAAFRRRLVDKKERPA